jgi:hypothetical protein
MLEETVEMEVSQVVEEAEVLPLKTVPTQVKVEQVVME